MKPILLAAGLACLAACSTLATAERNKAVARRAFSEILEKGHVELTAELYAPDFRNHAVGGDVTLVQDMAALRRAQAASPPDTTMRPELVVAEGEYVSVLWNARGTLQGRPQSMRGITLWRIVDGRIREEWSEFDEERMVRGLGLLPDPGAGAR